MHTNHTLRFGKSDIVVMKVAAILKADVKILILILNISIVLSTIYIKPCEFIYVLSCDAEYINTRR